MYIKLGSLPQTMWTTKKGEVELKKSYIKNSKKDEHGAEIADKTEVESKFCRRAANDTRADVSLL